MNPGDRAPDLTLSDHTGRDRQLAELWGDQPVVLFFYPKAMTGGCTAQACHFRDLAAEFAAVGAQRVGISTDAVADQAKFAERNDFDFPLLADVEGAAVDAFGVRRSGPLPNKRTTFVIDRGGEVLARIANEVSMDAHADEALAVLRARIG